jgi:hypothetical protein
MTVTRPLKDARFATFLSSEGADEKNARYTESLIINKRNHHSQYFSSKLREIW